MKYPSVLLSIVCIVILIFKTTAGSLSHLTRVVPEIDTLVVLDRDVDLYSPMVTPLTYEGLIDEIIGIFRELRLFF